MKTTIVGDTLIREINDTVIPNNKIQQRIIVDKLLYENELVSKTYLAHDEITNVKYILKECNPPAINAVYDDKGNLSFKKNERNTKIFNEAKIGFKTFPVDRSIMHTFIGAYFELNGTIYLMLQLADFNKRASSKKLSLEYALRMSEELLKKANRLRAARKLVSVGQASAFKCRDKDRYVVSSSLNAYVSTIYGLYYIKDDKFDTIIPSVHQNTIKMYDKNTYTAGSNGLQSYMTMGIKECLYLEEDNTPLALALEEPVSNSCIMSDREFIEVWYNAFKESMKFTLSYSGMSNAGSSQYIRDYEISICDILFNDEYWDNCSTIDNVIHFLSAFRELSYYKDPESDEYIKAWNTMVRSANAVFWNCHLKRIKLPKRSTDAEMDAIAIKMQSEESTNNEPKYGGRSLVGSAWGSRCISLDPDLLCETDRRLSGSQIISKYCDNNTKSLTKPSSRVRSVRIRRYIDENYPRAIVYYRKEW